MDRLSWLLQDISTEERQAALDYYEGYFEEAGEGQEQEVLSRLGSPEKVAAEIRLGMDGSRDADVQEKKVYTEKGYEDERFREPQKSPQKWGDFEKDEEHEKGFWQWWNRQSSIGRLILFGLFLFLLFSVAGGLLDAVFGIAGGAFGLIGGLIGLVFGLIAGVFGLTAAFFSAGIGLLGAGIAKIFTNPAIGFLYSGIGCLGIASGILMVFVCGWLCKKVIPDGICQVKNIFRKIFHGRRRTS